MPGQTHIPSMRSRAKKNCSLIAISTYLSIARSNFVHSHLSESFFLVNYCQNRIESVENGTNSFPRNSDHNLRCDFGLMKLHRKFITLCSYTTYLYNYIFNWIHLHVVMKSIQYSTVQYESKYRYDFIENRHGPE